MDDDILAIFNDPATETMSDAERADLGLGQATPSATPGAGAPTPPRPSPPAALGVGTMPPVAVDAPPRAPPREDPGPSAAAPRDGGAIEDKIYEACRRVVAECAGIVDDDDIQRFAANAVLWPRSDEELRPILDEVICTLDAYEQHRGGAGSRSLEQAVRSCVLFLPAALDV